MSHVWRAETSSPLLPTVRFVLNVAAPALPASDAMRATEPANPAIVFVNLLMIN